MKQDVYTYDRPSKEQEETTVEWHVNFADSDLFGYYGDTLFAQDEIQVAEHPALGHLKEALVEISEKEPGLIPRTKANQQGTPILITGIERRCSIATDENSSLGRPHGLYGSKFADSSTEAVSKATKAINPPTITNIIAMAALGNGFGRYSNKQIKDTFATAFTAFFGARLESIRLLNKGDETLAKVPQVIIHTGNWGTGAFGNNKRLIALLQLIAAYVARIDVLVYHTVDKSGAAAYRHAEKILQDSIINEASKDTTISSVLDQLYSWKFQWGVSDGN